MNIRLALSFLFVASALATTNDENLFVKVYIKKISNQTSANCFVDELEVKRGQERSIEEELLIPFISIRKYLKQYATKQAFTPTEALKIRTIRGTHHIWESEAGVVAARNPQEVSISLDSWKTKKLLSSLSHENGGKKKIFATLVLKMIQNRIKISLEPASS